MDKITYNTKDVAELLGIGVNRALTLMRTPGFPSFRLGNTYLIHKEEFYKWLKDTAGSSFLLD